MTFCSLSTDTPEPEPEPKTVLIEIKVDVWNTKEHNTTRTGVLDWYLLAAESFADLNIHDLNIF